MATVVPILRRVPLTEMDAEMLDFYCYEQVPDWKFLTRGEKALMVSFMKKSVAYMRAKCMTTETKERLKREALLAEEKRREAAIRRQRERQIPVSHYKVDSMGNIIGVLPVGHKTR